MRDERPQATELRLPLEASARSSLGPMGSERRVRLLGIVLIFVALLAPLPWWARALACIAVATGLALYRRKARPLLLPQGWVCLDAEGITRTEGATVSTFARWDEPFGLTVFANEAWTRAVLAFTTLKQTRYLAVRLGAESAHFANTLLARVVTVADGDLSGETRASLRAEDAAHLVRAAGAKSPRALECIYLSDPRGEGIVLEGTALTIGTRAFDLTLPLEWHGSMFHETGTHLATIYQATWVRQGGVEVALVAPMPAEMSMRILGGDGTRGVSVQRAIVHDLGLMQSPPEAAPPRDLRVAIERLFMLPLRRALDRAPRVSRTEVVAPDGPPAVQT